MREAEISLADYPQIRYYKVPRKFYRNKKYRNILEGVLAGNCDRFCSYSLLFCQNIHKELNIPIGIIQVPVRWDNG